jgi:hypothetical protein
MYGLVLVFLSVVSGFEAHGKKICDILVQLSGFEDQFSKNSKNLGFGNTGVVHRRCRRRQYPKMT